MKLVCISDFHGCHKYLKLPSGDVLVIAGDATDRGTRGQVKQFSKWLQGLEFKHIIFVAGNHDWYFEKNTSMTRKQEKLGKAIYLQDSEVIIENIKFYGSPWQPAFCNWAFNKPRNGLFLEKIWEKIPNDTDVLITHTPPFGILDQNLQDVRCGDELLYKRVIEIKPMAHIFGHIHGSFGIRTHEDILFANVSQLNENYNKLNFPVELEIGDMNV